MDFKRVLQRIWKPLSVIVAVFAFCTAGFVLTEGVSWFTGVYWGLTTLSTVGYGDVVPTNTPARIFAMTLMLTTVGVIGYLVSTITMLAMQAREEELLGTGGTKMTGHTVLLGWTQTAKSTLTELILSGEKVALMTRKQEAVVEIRTYITHLISHSSKDPELRDRVTPLTNIYIGYGDYTEKSALAHLNLEGAAKAVIASDDDAHNVMTSLILKELAPHLRIVVALIREHFRETLQAAGVTYVISPSEMGGRVLAEAALQPEVAISLDQMTSGGKGAAINEYIVPSGSPLAGKTFGEAAEVLRKNSGAILVGMAQRNPGNSHVRYTVSMAPSPDVRLEAESYLLALTPSARSEESLEKYLGVKAGRERFHP
jgi:voltage-gated potassium channel